jgi:hypothetical protein
MEKFDLTFEKFKELLNYSIDNNYLKVDKKGVICEKPCDEIRSPLSFFLLDDNLNSKEVERYFHHKASGVDNTFAMMEYYLLYKNTHNGKEPFNIMEYVNDVAEVGSRYGWRGNPFNILLSKKIEGNTLEAKVMYCNTNGGGFRLYKSRKMIFNFDSKDHKQFENDAWSFSSTFKYKEFELPYSKMEMIQRIEKEIETQNKALKELKKTYD